MKAKLVEYNFERGRDPKGKIGIGYGPAKPQFIEDFETAMDDFGIEIRKESLDSFPDVIVWTLTGPGDLPMTILEKTVFLFSKPDKKGRHGWSFNPIKADSLSTKDYYDNPYEIIKFIAKQYHGDIDQHIQALKDTLNDYVRIGEKMSIWSKKRS